MGCYRIDVGGSPGWICGNLGPHCRHCARVGDMLCDYPVGDGKTCDAPLCVEHASEVAPDLHYCPAHLEQWDKFVASGGVARELQNVVPFKR